MVGVRGGAWAQRESATKRVTGHDEGGMYRVKCVWDVARTGLSPISTPGELL